MECDLLSLSMRKSLFDIGGILLPVRPSITSSTGLNKTFQFGSGLNLLSLRSNASSCVAFSVEESDLTRNLVVNHAGKFRNQLAKRIRRIPRKSSSCEQVNASESNKRLKGNVERMSVMVDERERLRWYSRMLNDCAVKESLHDAKAVHGQVIRIGIEPDMHLWVSLINVYSKLGNLLCARRLFDEMPERDVVSWTALIAGFVGQGYGSEGVSLFCEMHREGVQPNEFTLATGLKACSMSIALDFGKQIHTEAIKLGLLLDLFVGSSIVDLYAKCGQMESAERMFICMPEQNAVSWNALLNGYAELGDGEEVLKLFCKMTESEIRFSKFNLSAVLKGCANSGNLRDGQAVHSLSIKTGLVLDRFVSCSLVDMYSRCGMVDSALTIFKRIKDPDMVTWSAMIACLDQHGLGQEATGLFYQMRCAGVRPNQYSLASLVSAATDLGNLQYGESIHSLICKCGFAFDRTVGNALVTMYMRNKCIRTGIQLFEAMTEHDTISWNALLSGFHELESCNHGPKIFFQMLADGFEPNVYTFINVLRSCSGLLDINFGRQVHAQAVKNSFHGNDSVGTGLIDMYAKCGHLKDAELVFNRLINRDVFTWTVMIDGYAQTDQVEKAVNFFNWMQQDGVKPNEFTLASCLSGCSRMATLQNGQQLHSIAIKTGQFDDAYVASALVDMYVKSGCIEDAKAIFEGLVSRDTVLWNTMICGYSQHGKGEESLKTFKIMLDEGNFPDEITFIGVLSACSHMGLIEEGKRHFQSLREVYNITPTTDHYACMVNILGRAGKFDEVESFIKEMNLTDRTLIWETVLGACKLHANVELGQKAANKLFDLEPNRDSNYVLLSNIFAAKGRWNDARKVRALMSSQGVKKEPGCSWVEVNGCIHVFISQDSSHPNIKEICLKLEELKERLISAGYAPKTECVLHNVTEREKVEHLYNHSERLALGFALISTKPFKPIRIFKNLRICGDCHEFMKFISSITAREVVIRDVSRFHHFRSGACSCQDYW